MNPLQPETVLRLAPGCRLSEPGAPEDLLLIPEGALRLKGPARAIVELCTGERSVRAIVQELLQRFGSADSQRVESETIALLTRLRDRGALESV
jgi:coenzyme PQQ biosynthesis protein PqqD